MLFTENDSNLTTENGQFGVVEPAQRVKILLEHAHDIQGQGDSALLEIQVKRNNAFTPSNKVFRAVVGQIVEASRRTDFWTSRCELSIATARTSRKIDGAYQDVLTWARRLGDPRTYMDRIDRPGSANLAIRTFVRTFKSQGLTSSLEEYDCLMSNSCQRRALFGCEVKINGKESTKYRFMPDLQGTEKTQ